MVTSHSPSVEGTIEGFSPTSVCPKAAVFARHVVAQAHPARVARAKALLFAATKLGDFAVSIGVEPSAEMLCDEALIERFILCGTEGHSAATRRTLRTNLRALARAVAPRVGPGAVPLPRERAKVPYSQGEIDAYLALAAAQPTRARRLRAGALIGLGPGAGLLGADLRGVRGVDVMARSGGLVVVVGGKRPRVVPVLARYHDLLGESAAFAKERYVVGGNDRHRYNVTTPLISSLTTPRPARSAARTRRPPSPCPLSTRVSRTRPQSSRAVAPR
jgi:integrase